MEMADWDWWCGLLFGAVPLLALAMWHMNDMIYCTLFALRRVLRRGDGEGTKRVTSRLPPGDMGLPFIGESLAMRRYFKIGRPDDFFTSKHKRYGKGVGMYRTHLFGSPTILTCAPASNKFVLQSPECFGFRWHAPELVGLLSISNVEGEQHARIREFILTNINQPNSLRKIATFIQPHIVAALKSWAEKGTITAMPEIRKVTFEYVCKMFVSMDPSPVTKKIDEWFAGIVAGFRSFPLDLPGTSFHHARKCRKRVNAVFREELERRKRAMGANDETKHDLMDGLMEMKDGQGKHLSDDEVVDNIVSLVHGGYESTSLAITWAVYLLSKSPDTLRKLREETMPISKEKNGGFITLDDISRMKYATKLVEETFRVANISPMIHRVAHRDVEYRGYTIPKGWNVIVWIRSLHTDANNFEDPLSFNPERWDKPVKPGTYQPFGGGYRTCAGNMLARLQMTLMIYHLSIGYRWELLNPDAKLAYSPLPTPVDGLAMKFSTL